MKKCIKNVLSILLLIVFTVLLFACKKNESSVTNEGGTVAENNESAKNTIYTEARKVGNHLYQIDYTSYDWNIANDYYSKKNFLDEEYVKNSGGCSGIQLGSLRGRNEDWYNDDMAEFIITTPKTENTHATLCVVSQSKVKDEDAAMGNIPDERYEKLVFQVCDGINDAGVCIQQNVVPNQDCKVYTTGTNPEGEDLSVAILQRYILDNATSVDNAIDLLKKKNIFALHSERFNQEIHFLLSDPKKAVVLEFVDNKMVVLEQNIITNYYLYTDKLMEYSSGVERYNILKENYQSVKDVNGMLDLMKKVWFTNCYKDSTNPMWKSDFVEGDITLNSPDEVFYDEYKKGKDDYEAGMIGNYTWLTTHTSVYDLDKLTLDVIAQEDGNVLHFELK